MRNMLVHNKAFRIRTHSFYTLSVRQMLCVQHPSLHTHRQCVEQRIRNKLTQKHLIILSSLKIPLCSHSRVKSESIKEQSAIQLTLVSFSCNFYNRQHFPFIRIERVFLVIFQLFNGYVTTRILFDPVKGVNKISVTNLQMK